MDKKRLLSIDALRGFDMLFIMGFAGLLVAICQLFPDGDSLIEIDFWYATPEAGEETASVISTIRAVNAEK